MTPATTPSRRRRRTRWQLTAARRYKNFYFLGGDGGPIECWVVVTRCKSQQVKGWRYCLRASRDEAAVTKARCDEGCCTLCEGPDQHIFWKLL